MKIDELVEGVEYKYDGAKCKIEDGEFKIFDKPYNAWKNIIGTYKMFADMEFEECEFEPMYREDYYYPLFDSGRRYGISPWVGNKTDNNIKRVVGVYRTKEQAIQKAKELGWVE